MTKRRSKEVPVGASAEEKKLTQRIAAEALPNRSGANEPADLD